MKIFLISLEITFVVGLFVYIGWRRYGLESGPALKIVSIPSLVTIITGIMALCNLR